jgi:hypothetical protein
MAVIVTRMFPPMMIVSLIFLLRTNIRISFSGKHGTVHRTGRMAPPRRHGARIVSLAPMPDHDDRGSACLAAFG